MALSHDKLELSKDIDKEISKRKWQEVANFYLHQSFTWVSVLASFATAILAGIATGHTYTDNVKLTVVLLAALTATITLVNKNFSFDKRALWNAVFRSKLEALQRDLKYKNDPIDAIVEELNKLDLEMEISFPEIKKK
jgi:hypothetical protein